MNSYHNLTQVFETREKGARFDLELAIVTGETTRLAAAVCVLKLSRDRARRKAVCREPLCVEHYSYLPRLPPYDLGLRNIVELF